MRKKIKLLQLATVISMVALVIVHYAYLNKPTVSSLSDLQQTESPLMVIKGKKTPIVKTKLKMKYPADEAGRQPQMWLYKSYIHSIELDGVTVPVLVTGFVFKTEDMVVLVRSSNGELNKKFNLDQFWKEHPDATPTDYFLVQQRSYFEMVLMILVVILAYELIAAGFRRAKEMSSFQ